MFVTHDIDEALLLGDTIAVFAEGGRLAQFGTPEEILYSPADDFVRSFVSRSVAGLLDEQTVRQARARRLATSREAQNGAVEGEKKRMSLLENIVLAAPPLAAQSLVASPSQ